MVVLAASICTRGGKALLSRQFRELSRDRITELLANFPSLVGSSGGAHTSVEDSQVRYVYQPLEEFYIILITNKSSNILQDIDTLRLFALTVSGLLRTIDEREIFDNAFEIIAAFDEIINLGYKENSTREQIETFLKLESHEEKIHDIIERNKVVEANEEKKRKAKDIQRRELAAREGRKVLGDEYRHGDVYTQSPSVGAGASYPATSIEEAQTPLISSAPLRGGLQLGAKRKGPATNGAYNNAGAYNAGIAAISRSGGVPTPPVVVTPVAASPAPSSRSPNNGILITITEKVDAQISRDGTLLSLEVRGDLQLRINNPDLANSKILVHTTSGVQYKPHPNVDRGLFLNANTITLKDKAKAFPLNDQAIGVLRWRAAGSKDDTTYVPLIVSAWVSIDEIAQVTLEYELSSKFAKLYKEANVEIDSFKILLPIQSHEVRLGDDYDHVSYEVADFGVVFTITSSLEDLTAGGSFEFSVPAVEEDLLFPLQLQFEVVSEGIEELSLGGVRVEDVVSTSADEELLPFDLKYALVTEEYHIA